MGSRERDGRCLRKSLIVALAAVAALTSPIADASEREKEPKRPPRALFGIQSFETLSEGELAALRKGRIGFHRVFIAWPGVERAPGERRWDYWDYQIGIAAQHRLKILPVLIGTAHHAGAHIGEPPVRSTAAIAGWSSFAADTVRRYGPGGEFWRLNPGLPYLPIKRWQVWNEPSSNFFWDGAPNSEEYATLVKATARAVRGVDPGARIILAGLLPHRFDPTGHPIRRFLRRFYRVPGIRRHFDAVALHPYTIRPPRVIALAEQVRRLMRRNHDKNASLLITEMGWPTGGPPKGAVTMRGQARKLTRSYEMLLRRRRALGLEGIVWHVLRDFKYPGSDDWALHTGLFRVEKVAKPAWPAFTRITGGRAAAIVEPPGQQPPPPPPTTEPPPEPCFLLIFC